MTYDKQFVKDGFIARIENKGNYINLEILTRKPDEVIFELELALDTIMKTYLFIDPKPEKKE